MGEPFEPRLLAFLCNWCSYAGADMAGISRVQYRPSLRAVRVMCSGRVNPVFIFEGFLAGFDGVLVLGCHPGDCHYLTGNYQAERTIAATRKLVEICGLAPERLDLDWVSAAEGQRFARIVDDFTGRVAQAGPLVRDDVTVRRLAAARLTAGREKVRWLIGNARSLIGTGNVFGEKLAPATLDELIAGTLRREFYRAGLLLAMNGTPVSAGELAAAVNLPAGDVLTHLVDLMEEGEVFVHDFVERTPRYIRAGRG